jgi:hypothetical protein
MGHLADPAPSAAVAGADIYHDIYPPQPTSTPTSTPTAAPLSSEAVAAGRDGRHGRRFPGYLSVRLSEGRDSTAAALEYGRETSTTSTTGSLAIHGRTSQQRLHARHSTRVYTAVSYEG